MKHSQVPLLALFCLLIYVFWRFRLKSSHMHGKYFHILSNHSSPGGSLYFSVSMYTGTDPSLPLATYTSFDSMPCFFLPKFKDSFNTQVSVHVLYYPNGLNRKQNFSTLCLCVHVGSCFSLCIHAHQSVLLILLKPLKLPKHMIQNFKY